MAPNERLDPEVSNPESPRRGGSNPDFNATEREMLRILKGFNERKAALARQAQQELAEANQVLQDYLALLAKARGLEGEGWNVTPDLARFVRSPGAPGASSQDVGSRQKAEGSRQQGGSNEIQNS